MVVQYFFYLAMTLFAGSFYLSFIAILFYPLTNKREKFMMFVHKFTLFSAALVAIATMLAQSYDVRLW
jgi:hypothetical protein